MTIQGFLTELCRDDEGALMLRFDPAPSWEEFGGWAVDLARRIGAEIGEQIDTPGAHLWRIVARDAELTFLYAGERGTYLIAYDASAEPALHQVRTLLESIAARIQSR